MTDNQATLIDLVCEHSHPEQALCVAIETILMYLTRRESFELKHSVDSRECS